MTQEQVNAALQAFIQNFEANPYLHRCEHSLHVALYNELVMQAPQTFPFQENCITNFVHKEFPGRKRNEPQKQLVDRTQIDVVVLANQQTSSIKNFLEGNIDVDFAFELSLEYDIEHLCWDIFKFITGSNKSIDHKNYIIHLYHKKRDRKCFDNNKVESNLMWKNGQVDEKGLNKQIEWCYYLTKLCIEYAKKQEQNDFDKILAIIKNFVKKKNEKYNDDYLPKQQEDKIKDILKNMKFIMIDANSQFQGLTNV